MTQAESDNTVPVVEPETRNGDWMQQVVTLPKGVRGAAGDDIFNGDDIAVEALGPDVKAKNSGLLALAYLWRRFGPPWWGSDPHKDLCKYILTTPDPEVWLIVRTAGSSLDLGISYCKTEALQEEQATPFREWEKKFEAWWCKENGIDCDKEWPEEIDGKPNEELESIRERFWEDRMKSEVAKKAALEIGQYPRFLYDPKKWRDGNGVCRRVNQAIYDALKELLRPVYVRDVPINIFGRCNNADDPAEQSKYAGYGCDREAMEQLIAKEAEEVPSIS